MRPWNGTARAVEPSGVPSLRAPLHSEGEVEAYPQPQNRMAQATAQALLDKLAPGGARDEQKNAAGVLAAIARSTVSPLTRAFTEPEFMRRLLEYAFGEDASLQARARPRPRPRRGGRARTRADRIEPARRWQRGAACCPVTWAPCSARRRQTGSAPAPRARSCCGGVAR